MTSRRGVIGGGLFAAGAAMAFGPSRLLAQVPGQLAAPEAQNHPAKPSFGDLMVGDLGGTHDPCIIKEGDTYYVFGSDQLSKEGEQHCPWRTSKDLVHWTYRGFLFDHLPPWAQTVVPGTRGMWAPDVTLFNGRYHLYYALSTFGGNRSAIGLYTNSTLNPADKGYKWKDEGVVIASTEKDDYNCIDPAQFEDRDGRHWMVFGSFWGGIKSVEINAVSGKPAPGSPKINALIQRPAPTGAPDAVEAPFMIERNGWYYLFASFDYCCKGVDSSYYIVVGRSRSPTGPFVGVDGRSMLSGYGTLELRGDRRWRGPGHEAVLRDGGRDYLVYHVYDAADGGASKLRISPITWTADGWPRATL